MRKKIIIFTGTLSALALLIGLAVFPTVQATAVDDDRSGKNLQLVIRTTGRTPVDLPPTGASAGDKVVFDNPLYDRMNTNQVGASKGVCEQIGGSESVYHCVVTFVLADGQITGQGVADFAQTPQTVAVTGGTGKYKRAQGQVTFTETSPTTDEIRVELK